MSAYISVDIPGVDDGPGAEPWIDVAHDSGIYGGKVRVLIGADFDHISNSELTPEQAKALAIALYQAAYFAEAFKRRIGVTDP